MWTWRETLRILWSCLARPIVTSYSSILPDRIKVAYPELLKNWKASRGSWKQVNFDPMWSGIRPRRQWSIKVILCQLHERGLLGVLPSTRVGPLVFLVDWNFGCCSVPRSHRSPAQATTTKQFKAHQKTSKITWDFEFSENSAPLRVTLWHNPKPNKTSENAQELPTLCLCEWQLAFEMRDGHLLPRFFLFALLQLVSITNLPWHFFYAAAVRAWSSDGHQYVLFWLTIPTYERTSETNT